MMKRTLALTLTGALVAGCSGTRLLPVTSGGPAAREMRSDTMPSDGSAIETFVQMRIPRRSGRRPDVHPSTISPATQSVSIAVNANKAQIFNATTASPGCAGGSTGITCTFAVHAQAGTDTFTVSTYSGLNASGTVLDRGIKALVPIAKGKANKIAVRLGPVVTNANNTGIGSLRYAIAGAGPGDTITFLLAKGATITLTSPIVLTGTLAIAGPGAADLTISGGGAHQLFEVAGTATITGLTLVHARAAIVDSPGGAIENIGTLTLQSDAFGANTSTVALRRSPEKHPMARIGGLHPHCSTTYREGGAIYNAGALTISNTTFTGNVIQNSIATCFEGEGGAIFNDVTGTLSSTHDSYASNSAALGGAIYNNAIGAATFTDDTFAGNYGCAATSGCPTSGCGATSCTSHAVGEGGAIYDNGAGITITGSTFTGNVAGGKSDGSIGMGGAIYLASVLPTIAKSTFANNLAGGGTSSCSTGQGGAIFSANAIEIDGDAFTNNAATGDNSSSGGAIFAVTNITGTSDTFAGNKAAGTGGACTTSGEAAGGAIETGGVANLTGSTFSGNSATGGLAGQGGAILGGGSEVVISGCTFTSNAALATGTGAATSTIAAGGALVVTGIGKVSGSTFTSNSAKAETSVGVEAMGGAIVSGSSALLSSNDTFTSNSATLTGGGSSAGGGAVTVVSGTFSSSGDKFASNSATSTGNAGGGAVLTATGGFITNATFTANKTSAPLSGGGAISVAAGAILKHVVATGNSASGTIQGEGGALLDGGGASISDSELSQNTASTMGGAIFSTSNPETITESTIDDNVVTNAKGGSEGGGGIIELGGVVLSQTTVANNTLTVSGPGPVGGGGVLADGLYLAGSTVSGNKVLGTAAGASGGGGIFSAGTLIAVNSTVSNNSSSLDGGGIENLANSGVTLSNVTLFKNAAHAHGGNLENYTGGVLTLTNSILGGGTAASGPDAYNAGTLASGDYNVLQTAPAGTAFTGTVTHNAIADPKLLALSNNGGPTLTNADQATSPGKGHIPFASSACGSVSIAQDERGFIRGAGGHCDAGAYEYLGVATAIAHHPLPKPVFGRSSLRSPRAVFPHLVPI